MTYLSRMWRIALSGSPNARRSWACASDNKVQAQETLFWTDLAIASDEQRDLSSLVQAGNRAVSIHARSGDKSYALIRPGDYVDVIGNLPADNGGGHQAVVLLQRVLVLAVGLETAPQALADTSGSGVAARDMVLTLSVGLQDAQLLYLGCGKGDPHRGIAEPRRSADRRGHPRHVVHDFDQ